MKLRFAGLGFLTLAATPLAAIPLAVPSAVIAAPNAIAAEMLQRQDAHVPFQSAKAAPMPK